MSWVINGHHIASYVRLIVETLQESHKLSGSSAAAFSLILREGDILHCEGGSPLCFLWSWLFCWDAHNPSFFSFVAELHIRSLVIGYFFFLLIRIPARLERRAQVIPYKKNFPASVTWWDRALLLMGGIWPSTVITRSHYEPISIKYQWVKWFREAILHPWSILTLWNDKREVLMVDVLTTEDSLYSGALATWIPEDNDLSAIAIDYVLRFYPKQAGRRNSYLIKNNGQLVLPANQIKTIHFWELRKGTKATVAVSHPNDAEKLKWNLLLYHIYPSFMTEVTILISLNDQEKAQFYKDIFEWAKAGGLMGVVSQLQAVTSNPKPPQTPPPGPSPKKKGP